MPRAISRSSSSDAATSLRALSICCVADRSPSSCCLEQAEVERQGHEPLLSPVVEVPLQALAFALGGLEDPRARATELLEPRSKLDVQLGVLQREAERGGDGAEELGLLLE